MSVKGALDVSRLPGRATHLQISHNLMACGRVGSGLYSTDDPQKVNCRICLGSDSYRLLKKERK